MERQSALHFQEAVCAFLRKLRVLNSQAYLLWAYGMCGHTMVPCLENAIVRYREETGDEKAKFLLLPTTAGLWVGSSNHPGAIAHEHAAAVLIREIEEYMKSEVSKSV